MTYQVQGVVFFGDALRGRLLLSDGHVDYDHRVLSTAVRTSMPVHQRASVPIDMRLVFGDEAVIADFAALASRLLLGPVGLARSAARVAQGAARALYGCFRGEHGDGRWRWCVKAMQRAVERVAPWLRGVVDSECFGTLYNRDSMELALVRPISRIARQVQTNTNFIVTHLHQRCARHTPIAPQPANRERLIA